MQPRRGPASTRGDGYLALEQYAAIGDSGSLALVGSDGSLDWLCLPHRDSPSVFGALVDAGRGGRFVVAPTIPFEVTRSYVPRTNVLRTTFRTAEGAVRLTDLFTTSVGISPRREIVRLVQGLGGSVPMHWHFEPRFDFGRRRARLQGSDGAVIARAGRLQLALQRWDAGEPILTESHAGASFDVAEGEDALLVLDATDAGPLPLPERRHVERRLKRTIDNWRSWVGGHSYEGAWADAVERSLLAIRLLTDGRTGAIAAAGTTSLPEVIGGERNYDYRYGWVRDLSFTLDALMRVGVDEPTEASLEWVFSAVARTHPRVDPVYTLDGAVLRSQSDLPLAGYRGAGPVRLGNCAGNQLQLGGFGDLIETVWNYVACGNVLSPEVGERIADIADLVCAIWHNEDAGLWELDSYAHYTTSKIGCWSALDRTLQLVDRRQAPARHVERWRWVRGEVRSFIERELFSPAKRAYRFKNGSDGLDCGTLLAARRGYVDPRGAQLNGTIDAICGELRSEGPLFYRYSGMQDEENAFLACSFWVAEAMALAGRFDESAEILDGMTALANDVGLYTEEMEPGTHAMRGNFPQALTHLALISAAAIFSQSHDRARGQSGDRARERS